MSDIKGNIYGVDIKLVPEPMSETAGMVPIGIEINGSNFGTDFFRYEEGKQYYRNFARELGRVANGKPIFINQTEYNEETELERRIKASKDAQKLSEKKAKLMALLEESGDLYDFDCSWIDDLIDFKRDSILNGNSEPEDSCYKYAARELDVPLIVYDYIKFKNNTLVFVLPDDKRIELKPEDIGLIRLGGESLTYNVPKRYLPLFLNSPLIEDVLDYKPLFRYLGTHSAKARLRYLFTPAVIYGLGVTHPEMVLEFLELIDSEFVVKKRGGSSCGTGVEILRREELIQLFKSKAEKIKGVEIEWKKFSKGFRGIATTLNEMKFNSFDFITVYEQFMPSIPVFNPKTGEEHDGCIRSVVYSPPNGRPVVLGSQWRLAPKSMNNANSSLEDRFRANLSRGATAMPIEQDLERYVSIYAAMLVEAFEDEINDVLDGLNIDRERWKRYLHKDELDADTRTASEDMLNKQNPHIFLRAIFLYDHFVGDAEKGYEHYLKGIKLRSFMRELDFARSINICSPLVRNVSHNST